MGRHSDRDDLSRFHEHDVHLPTRTIYLGSETDDENGESGVNAVMVKKFIKNLRALDSASRRPITIVLNNPGGDYYHGIAIYDAIRACRSKIIIEVFGHAMSMGSVILQAADVRIMSENSSQMIHYGTLSYSGHSKTAIRWADQEKRINRRVEEIYWNRMLEKNKSTTLVNIKTLLEHDTFLTAQESVALGLADHIKPVLKARKAHRGR